MVDSTFKERFGKPVKVPVLYWHKRDCQFVVFKIAENRFRNQFFYSVKDQFGTGPEEYDDLGDCALTLLLRIQADHESTRVQQ